VEQEWHGAQESFAASDKATVCTCISGVECFRPYAWICILIVNEFNRLVPSVISFYFLLIFSLT
jgi:hypothetical protein